MQLNKHPAIAALIIVVLVGAVTGAVVISHNNKEAQENNAALTANAANATTSNTTTATQYKDGSYTQSADYITPGGKESITVTVVIKGNTITDSSVENVANNRDSREYQALFANNYKSKVVGKSVNEVSLSRVAGSSLTSSGFNNALEQIKNEAQV